MAVSVLFYKKELLLISTLDTKIHDELTEKRRTYLFTRLLVSVLQVVQFCGSLPNHDNIEECRTLLVFALCYLCSFYILILHSRN
jgi:hypothetical protein